MSITNDVVTAAFGAGFAAIFGGLGFLLARAMTRGDRRTQQDSHQDTAIQLMQRDITQLQRNQEQGQRHRQAMSEELATISAILERHEAWHDRHDPTTP